MSYQKRYEDRNDWLARVNRTHPKNYNCLGCPLQHVGASFATNDGTGSNGLCLIDDYLDEASAEKGNVFEGVGRSVLNTILHRVGLKRADFLLTSTIRCNPPLDKLVGESYEQVALHKCSPYFDATLKGAPQVQVLMPMGELATKQLLGVDKLYTHHGTVHWHSKYERWVVPTFSPFHLASTGLKEVLTVISDLNTALEVIKNGYTPPVYEFIEYPTHDSANGFLEEYEAYLKKDPTTLLSVDIETPYSGDIDEEDKDGKDSSWTVERISFTFRAGHAITMPWCEPFIGISRRLLSSDGDKLFWNGNKFDVPRLRNVQCSPSGRIIDGMDAFHFLYSDLPRGLGYASPFFTRHKPWKHLSGSNMPFYSCMDSLAAWDILCGTRTRLLKDGLWNTFLRDFVDIEPTFQSMGEVGIGLNQTVQAQLREHYVQLRDNSNAIINQEVPDELKPLAKPDGYKGTPKPVREWLAASDCPKGKEWTKLSKDAKRDWADKGFVACGFERIAGEWNKRLDFNPNSGPQIQAYITHMYGVGAIPRNKKDKDKFTTGSEELNRLAARKNDKVLFTIIDSSSAGDKLTAITNNFPIGADGRIHSVFSNNPATFRLSSIRPNLQNVGHRTEELDKIREMIIAGDNVDDDWWILENDFSGIEAIEVGWYAQDSAYMRMAKLGVHSFYASALPQINITLDPKWSDDELKAGIKDVKRLAKSINAEGTETALYDLAKRTVHGTNYLMGANLLHDTYPECFSTRKIAQGYQDRYYELFPQIKTWQIAVYTQADEQNYLINDFGYRRWFWDAMRWAIDKRTGKWVKVPSGDAKKAVATLPQGSAAAIIRHAMMTPEFQEIVARRCAMLQIHDSLVCRARFKDIDEIANLLKKAMLYPIKEQSGLIIPSECKIGKNWRAQSKGNPNGMIEIH